MTSISAWWPFMQDTVTIETASSRDAYGEITYGSAVTYPARVVGKQQLVRSLGGQEVVSSHTVYLGSNVVLQPDAAVRLSSGLVNSTQESALYPPILSVARYPDEMGSHHTVIYLG